MPIHFSCEFTCFLFDGCFRCVWSVFRWCLVDIGFLCVFTVFMMYDFACVFTLFSDGWFCMCFLLFCDDVCFTMFFEGWFLCVLPLFSDFMCFYCVFWWLMFYVCLRGFRWSLFCVIYGVSLMLIFYVFHLVFWWLICETNHQL